MVFSDLTNFLNKYAYEVGYCLKGSEHPILAKDLE